MSPQLRAESAGARACAVAAAVLLLLGGCGTATDVTDAAGDLVTPGTPAGPTGGAPAAETRPGRLPSLTLDRLGEEGRVDLAGIAGPAIVNVWASWCGPCRTELPALGQFAREARGDVEVWGIDILDADDAAEALLSQTGADFPSLRDPEGLSRGPLLVVGPPVTLFVAPDGTVVHRVDGGIDTIDQWRALAREHLGVSP